MIKKEIILSPFTVFEVVNMVKIAGGIPVFADLTFPSAELNLKNIKKKISKNTAGVLFTQYHSYNLEIKCGNSRSFAVILGYNKNKKNIKELEKQANVFLQQISQNRFYFVENMINWLIDEFN